VFCLCVYMSECEMHQDLKLLAAALPKQKDYRFCFKNLLCSTDVNNGQDSDNCKLLLKNYFSLRYIYIVIK
jgi:hypothetical protein